MIAPARARTLTVLIAAMLLVALGALPTASAGPPSGWVSRDGNAIGIPTGINGAGDVLMLDPRHSSYRLIRADGGIDLQVPHLFADLEVVGPTDAGQTAVSYRADSTKIVAGTFDRDGTFTAMADPEQATVVDINNNGVVIGVTSFGGRRHIVHWSRYGHPHDVDTGARDVYPAAINDRGQMTAWIDGALGPAGRRGAVFNRNGRLLRYLHRFRGEDYSQPKQINNNGVVIGVAHIPDPDGGAATLVPLRWGNLGRSREFVTPDGATAVHVDAINNHGVAVGTVTYPAPAGDTGVIERGGVWTSTDQVHVLTGLPSSVPPGEPQPPDVVEATALNERNVLAGLSAVSDYAELTIWQPSS